MRVLKFGGTSLADGRRIRHVARLVRRAAKRRRVIVVASAMAGVTDRLCGLIEDAVAARPVDRGVGAVERQHLEALDNLDPTHRWPAVESIRRRIYELRRDLQKIVSFGACPDHIRDRVMATGERLSVTVLTAVLRSFGCPARVVDGSEVVLTDNRFGEARVDHVATRRACAGLRERPTVEVPVVTGFVGADPKGRTTTLGRGGSDFSAALLGAALDAERVEIWTDVDGVLTAPPDIVSEASRISRLSYEEAAELSHFGATVLHPRTVEPLVAGRIPIIVRNTLDPTRPGTEIGPNEPTSPRVVAVSAVPEAKVLSLTPIAERSAAPERSPLVLAPSDEILMACSASSGGSALFVTLEAKAADVAGRLASAANITVTDNGPASLVALVGHNLGSQPWAAGRALEALGRRGLTVRAVAAGSSPHALTILVERDELETVLTTVHDVLGLKGDLGPERPVEVVSSELMIEEALVTEASTQHRRAS